MNAYVEVATAEVAVRAGRVETFATTLFLPVVAPVVATFTKRVLSIAGTSLSAVSPDYILIGGTA